MRGARACLCRRSSPKTVITKRTKKKKNALQHKHKCALSCATRHEHVPTLCAIAVFALVYYIYIASWTNGTSSSPVCAIFCSLLAACDFCEHLVQLRFIDSRNTGVRGFSYGLRLPIEAGATVQLKSIIECVAYDREQNIHILSHIHSPYSPYLYN